MNPAVLIIWNRFSFLAKPECRTLYFLPNIFARTAEKQAVTAKITNAIFRSNDSGAKAIGYIQNAKSNIHNNVMNQNILL